MQKNEMARRSQETALFEATLGDMVRIFSAISSEDSMKIFYAAKDGIKSSTTAIKELGLTQKRYYTRLKELLDAGLIQKEDDAYRHTVLGKICYKLGGMFMETLSHSEQLELIDKVRKSRSVETSEKDKIAEALMKHELYDSSPMSEFLMTENMRGLKKVVKIVDKYENLVKIVAECYDRAEKEIKMASRYTPSEVTEKVGDAIARGLRMEWIDGDKSNLSTKLQVVKMVFMNPKAAISFYQAVNNPNNELMFYHKLPYCIMIADGRFGALEVPDPLTGQFLFAVFFEDQDLCEKLSNVFEKLKEKSTQHPYKELAKSLGRIKV